MKKIVSFVLVAVIFAMQLSVTASATELETQIEHTEVCESVQPRLNVTVGATLNNTSWSTIVTDNNWLTATITISSDSSNLGDIKVKVSYLDGGGDITTAKKLSPGGSVELGPVAWNSGKYKIVAITTDSNNNGHFTFKIKDKVA